MSLNLSGGLEKEKVAKPFSSAKKKFSFKKPKVKKTGGFDKMKKFTQMMGKPSD